MTTSVCTNLINGCVVPLAANSAALTLPGPTNATVQPYSLPFYGQFGNQIMGPAVTCDALAFSVFLARNNGVLPNYIIPLN